jgi:hypothetical protein
MTFAKGALRGGHRPVRRPLRQVAVDPPGRVERVVPQVFLHDLQPDTLLEHPRGVGMRRFSAQNARAASCGPPAAASGGARRNSRRLQTVQQLRATTASRSVSSPSVGSDPSVSGGTARSRPARPAPTLPRNRGSATVFGRSRDARLPVARLPTRRRRCVIAIGPAPVREA